MQDIILDATVPDHCAGKRLDQIAAELFPQYSRGRLQKWIKEGDLVVDGEPRKPKDKLIGGELLSVATEMEQQSDWSAEPVEFEVVYEDDAIVVVNKPVGLVVHPAAGNSHGTLVNGLLYRYPDQAQLPRGGIVHRLDKETSGLMVVAKSLLAHTELVRQLQHRTVHREYQAITVGVMTGGGIVDEPIDRHPRQRTKMAVVEEGKHAVTHYRVIQKYRGHTHISCKLETGRTHQIRVHMAHIHYPLVGDPLYGGRPKVPKGASLELIDAVRQFNRQALHAFKLGLNHPVGGDYMEWECPLPEDMQLLLAVLEADAAE